MRNMKRILKKSLFLIVILALAGCGNNREQKELFYSSRLNFYPEEYEEEYNQYTKTISIYGSMQELVIKSLLQDGKLDVEVLNPEGETVGTYCIEDNLEETIVVEKQHGEWKVKTKLYRETDGFISIEVY